MSGFIDIRYPLNDTDITLETLSKRWKMDINEIISILKEFNIHPLVDASWGTTLKKNIKKLYSPSSKGCAIYDCSILFYESIISRDGQVNLYENGIDSADSLEIKNENGKKYIECWTEKTSAQEPEIICSPSNALNNIAENQTLILNLMEDWYQYKFLAIPEQILFNATLIKKYENNYLGTEHKIPRSNNNTKKPITDRRLEVFDAWMLKHLGRISDITKDDLWGELNGLDSELFNKGKVGDESFFKALNKKGYKFKTGRPSNS